MTLDILRFLASPTPKIFSCNYRDSKFGIVQHSIGGWVGCEVQLIWNMDLDFIESLNNFKTKPRSCVPCMILFYLSSPNVL